MNLNYAMLHLRKLLEHNRGNFVKVEHNHQIAFNSLLSFIENLESKFLDNNIPFVNLYAFALSHFLKKYNTSIDNPIPHRKVHDIIDRPLENIISEITDQQNMRLKYQILQNSGIDFMKHPSQCSESETQTVLQNLSLQLDKADNANILSQGAWTSEEITKGIKKQITDNFTDGI